MHLNFVLFQNTVHFRLLEERMRFNLIYSRFDFVVLYQIIQLRGIEITYTDGFDFSGSVKFFHGFP